jgi:hypothetical protein
MEECVGENEKQIPRGRPATGAGRPRNDNLLQIAGGAKPCCKEDHP